jgi:hypothetical protein
MHVYKDHYRYQYFPYNDVNGERIIYIVGFTSEFQAWRDEPYEPRTDYGMQMFELRINLTEHNRSDIGIGGFG